MSDVKVSSLRNHREAAGLSQEALARRAGVSTSTIQKLEAGRTAPYLTTAIRLAHELSVSVAELFPEIEAA